MIGHHTPIRVNFEPQQAYLNGVRLDLGSTYYVQPARGPGWEVLLPFRPVERDELFMVRRTLTGTDVLAQYSVRVFYLTTCCRLQSR